MPASDDQCREIYIYGTAAESCGAPSIALHILSKIDLTDSIILVALRCEFACFCIRRKVILTTGHENPSEKYSGKKASVIKWLCVCMWCMLSIFLFSISLWNNENSSHMWVTHFLRSAGYRYVKKLRSLLSSRPRRHAICGDCPWRSCRWIAWLSSAGSHAIGSLVSKNVGYRVCN